MALPKPSTWRPAARWTGLMFALDLLWEIVQLPLYTLYRSGDAGAIAYAIAHCTAGDVLIATGCYGIAALAARSARWPVERPWTGIAAAITAGVLYTAFSEWLNVSVRGAWAYAEAMPTVYGIGVSPLLQWIAVPAGALLIQRKWAAA